MPQAEGPGPVGPPLLRVGHSTQALEELLELLRRHIARDGRLTGHELTPFAEVRGVA